MTASQQFWNESWQKRRAHTSRGQLGLEAEITRKKLDFLAPHLTAGMRAVEVGCGSASLLCSVGQGRSMHLTAQDNAPAALALARDNAAAQGLTVETIEGNVERMPLTDGAMDLVLSGGLLEHFVDPVPTLREMMRILRPGGVFYSDVVPCKFSLYRLREAWRMLRKDPHWKPDVFESTFGPEDYRRWLSALGCEQLEIVSCGVYPRAISYFAPALQSKLFAWCSRYDGTPIADRLGWYFMIVGRKA